MKKYSVILFFVLTVVYLDLFSAEMNIVDVRRNITLSDDDPIYKDFYINAGEGSGLKKNLVVNVKRKIYIKDPASKAVGDFESVVGQVRVIQVAGKVSIAREYKLTSREEEAMLEQKGIMTGDRLDLAGSFVDNTKPRAQVKTSEALSPVAHEGQREPAQINELTPPVPTLQNPVNKITAPAAIPEI
jgi:hypothetical protein